MKLTPEEIKYAFAQFHEQNPHVYTKLKEIALLMKEKGQRRFGIGAMFERLRWISTFETEGDIYKLNNNYRALYARMLMEKESELGEFFNIRFAKTDTL